MYVGKDFHVSKSFLIRVLHVNWLLLAMEKNGKCTKQIVSLIPQSLLFNHLNTAISDFGANQYMFDNSFLFRALLHSVNLTGHRRPNFSYRIHQLFI